MTCSCPKCAAKIEFDPTGVPDNGLSIVCQECKKRFLILQEFFVGRAYRRTGEISCANCGSKLGNSLHCPQCSTLYPDYFVVETTEARRKKRKRSVSLKEFDFSFTSNAARAVTEGYSPQHATGSAASSSSKRSGLILIIAALAIVVASSIIGLNMYKQHKLERKYTAFFTKTLYGMKSGADYCLVVSDKIIKEASEKGMLRISTGDESALSKVKETTDQYFQELKVAPTKFGKANEDVGKLYSAYVKLHSTVLSPTGTPQAFSEAVAQSDADFKRAAKELKGNLSDDLSKELKEATTKYKALRDL